MHLFSLWLTSDCQFLTVIANPTTSLKYLIKRISHGLWLHVIFIQLVIWSIPSPRLGDRKRTCWIKIKSNYKAWKILYVLTSKITIILLYQFWLHIVFFSIVHWVSSYHFIMLWNISACYLTLLNEYNIFDRLYRMMMMVMMMMMMTIWH